MLKETGDRSLVLEKLYYDEVVASVLHDAGAGIIGMFYGYHVLLSFHLGDVDRGLLFAVATYGPVLI